MDQTLATTEPFIGKWEEISSTGDRFIGKTVTVSVLEPKHGIEAARLTQPKFGTGAANEIIAWVRAQPTSDPNDDDLWDAIAENRAMRRQLTMERDL